MAYTEGGSMNIAGPYVSSSCSHRTEVTTASAGAEVREPAGRAVMGTLAIRVCGLISGVGLGWAAGSVSVFGQLSCIFCWALERAKSLVAALVMACVLCARVAETGTRCLWPCTCQRSMCTIQSGLRAAGTGRVV